MTCLWKILMVSWMSQSCRCLQEGMCEYTDNVYIYYGYIHICIGICISSFTVHNDIRTKMFPSQSWLVVAEAVCYLRVNWAYLRARAGEGRYHFPPTGVLHYRCGVLVYAAVTCVQLQVNMVVSVYTSHAGSAAPGDEPTSQRARWHSVQVTRCGNWIFMDSSLAGRSSLSHSKPKSLKIYE